MRNHYVEPRIRRGKSTLNKSGWVLSFHVGLKIWSNVETNCIGSWTETNAQTAENNSVAAPWSRIDWWLSTLHWEVYKHLPRLKFHTFSFHHQVHECVAIRQKGKEEGRTWWINRFLMKTCYVTFINNFLTLTGSTRCVRRGRGNVWEYETKTDGKGRKVK